MSTESICEDLWKRADELDLNVCIDKIGKTWYATVMTRGSYSNLLVRTFEAKTLEELAKRVRFPLRTPSGRAVYL